MNTINQIKKQERVLLNLYFSKIEKQFSQCIKDNIKKEFMGSILLKQNTKCELHLEYPLANKKLLNYKLEQHTDKIIGKSLWYNEWKLQDDNKTIILDVVDPSYF